MSAVRGEGVAETETSRVVKVYIEAFVDLRFSKMVDAARGVWVYVRERIESATTSIVFVIVLVVEERRSDVAS